MIRNTDNQLRSHFAFEEKKKRRQFGTEKICDPLPAVSPSPSEAKLVWSRLGIFFTIAFWIAYLTISLFRQILDNGATGFRFTMEASGYLLIVTLLTISALVYLMARDGALRRFSQHQRIPRISLDKFFSDYSPSLTVLIPSYAEEPNVIWQTMLSAALQEYKDINIVLLIDDPPIPSSNSVRDRLELTRSLPQQIEDLLAQPHEMVEQGFTAWEKSGCPVDKEAITTLADLYRASAAWLCKTAKQETCEDHVDVFLVEQVYRDLSEDFESTALALESAKSADNVPLVDEQRLWQLYSRLTSTFSVSASCFERKQYLSTSHEANKAMNLNSYIGLMGKSYSEIKTEKGVVLFPCQETDQADISIPDSEYLLTLDADSILLREYCLRLVYLMNQPGNERVAVTQTPYSSFRGAGTRIERLAGATTDLQHIQHQGMTYYDATFWVGANAVIRKAAIEEIGEPDIERGFPITRYIQDRTVIEDTESSIDMANHGWKLINYPERLSYSATPPDFGSLVIQRQRWANGGLLILPKMFKKSSEGSRRYIRFGEAVMRINYMASIAWASFSLVFLLAYPYDGRLLSPFVVAVACPYFLSMASDLHSCGYKRTDIFRIYGFNLILLPVNLAGVVTSIRQGLTGRKIPFARTPKVKDRTVTPVRFILMPLAIIGFSLLTFLSDFDARNYGNAAFALLNMTLATWAFVSFIGIRNSIVDLWIGGVNFLFVEVPLSETDSADQENNWRDVLDLGPELALSRESR